MIQSKRTTGMTSLIVMVVLTTGNHSAGQQLASPSSPSLPTHQPTATSASSAPGLSDGYGDSLPPKAVARLGSIRLRHTGNAMNGNGGGLVVFSYDGKSLFTMAGMRNSLRQWDVASGKLIRQFDDRVQQSNLLVSSPDGKTLATSGQGNQVFLWDIATGKLLKQWPSNIVIALTFSPDGKTLTATCRDSRVRIWDVASGKELQTQAIGSVDAEAQVFLLSATGKTLVSSSQKDNKITVRLWDVVTGKKLHQLPELKDSPFSHTASSLAFSPNGRYLATASSSEFSWGAGGQHSDGAVRLWDVTTGKEVRHIVSDTAGTSAVAFSPDGKLLATGSVGGPIRLWEVDTGKELRRCQGYRSHIVSLAFSVDGTRLASGSSGNDQAARVWEVATGKELTPPLGGHTAPLMSLDFTPDGKNLVSGARDGRVCVWDMETGRERRPPLQAGDYQAVATLSADGTTIASIGNVFTPHGGSLLQSAMSSPSIVRLWDMATGQEKRQFPGSSGCAQSMSLSHDGKSLLSVYFLWTGALPAPNAGLWNVESGKQFRTVHNNAGGQAFWMNAAFSPDNKFYAVSAGDGSLSLYDVATGKRLDHCKGSEAANNGSVGMAFSSDGQELATIGMSTDLARNQSKLAICLWHLGSDKKQVLEEGRAITGHEGTIFALAYSPDGKTIASAGENGAIYVWETVSGKERCRFSGHHGQIWCLAFAPDGRRIASGSNDTTILIWDVTERLDHGQLRPASLSPQAMEKLWADLASSDARQAGQAVWSFAAAPDRAIALLKKQLIPIPIVKGLEQRIAQLIKELDDDVFRVRKKAMNELTKLGEAAEPAIRRMLASSASAETKNRARQLLATLQKKKTAPSNEDYRRSRALEVVEQCGTAAARQLLEALAQGEPTAPLTREARACLARLSRRAIPQP